MSVVAPSGHVGVEYRGDQDLAERLVPRVTRAFERGGRVLAWLSGPAREALQGLLFVRGVAEPVTYLDPVALGAEDDTVARQLRALSARGVPALVIASSALAHGHRPVLARLPDDPHELICTWRHDAPRDVLDEHRRRHPQRLVELLPSRHTATVAGDGSPTPPAKPPGFVVTGPHGLRELRAWISRLVEAGGLDAARRLRTAVAVHEATLVVSGLLAADADDAVPDPTWVRARFEHGEFVVDIQSRHPRRGLLAARADEALEVVRAFCDQVSCSGPRRTARIRVRVHTPGWTRR